MLKYVKQWKFFYEFCISAYFLVSFWIFQTIGPKFSCLGAFKPVVLKLGSAVLLGSARQFSGTAKHLSKNQHDVPKEKFFCKTKFSGILFFQTKLNKHNLL